jgi:hypothetical protein
VRLRAYTTLALVLAAGLAAGCGADDEGEPIPREIAAELQDQLRSIQDRLEFPGGAACGDITGGTDPNTTPVRRLIDSIPGSVETDVVRALEESFDHLFQLVERECADQPPETETETDTTETVPPPETETDTTETVPPVETDTIPTETLPPVEPPVPEAPPSDGESDGDGDGGGGFGPEEGDE